MTSTMGLTCPNNCAELKEARRQLRIHGVIWLSDVPDKLAFKHHVTAEEFEDVLVDDSYPKWYQ